MAGFKSLIQRQVQGAMRILGTDDDGLAPTVTYVAVAEGAYDYEERKVINTETAYEGVPAAMVRFQIDDMDEKVKPQTDRRALIASLDLPVTPSEQDHLLASDGTKWTVMRILSDPADALIILHTRRE
ncbi:head-tail attachment [Ruegeria phage RpAliso]|nr:head-tail attachment [Ruegeria phage RpAliso]